MLVPLHTYGRASVLRQVLVAGDASVGGPGVYFQLPKELLWGPAAPGDPQQVKREPWQVMAAKEVRLSKQEQGYQESFRQKEFKPTVATLPEGWAPDPEMANRKQREIMTEYSQEGEKPWTNMDPWGSECISQAVHVIGFAVGYQNLTNFNKTVTDSKKNKGFVGFDIKLEPPLGRPPPDGSWDGTELRERQSAPSARQSSSSASNG